MSENTALADSDSTEIRRLIDSWAHYADRRMPRDQAALFTENGTLTVHTGTPDSAPVQILSGRDELAEAFRVLETYEVTTHLNGQSMLRKAGTGVTGESYCMAHHVWTKGGVRTLMVMAIRYLDVFILDSGTWLFAQRRLIIDWADERPLGLPAS